MRNGDPRSWFDRVIGLCFGILAGAVAIYIAVQLIESVAVELLVIISVALGIVVLGCITNMVWQRHRMNRW